MSDSKQNIKTSRFKIIQIPKMVDERGSLCVVNGDESFPFEVKRVFWIYGVPFGQCRGKHAHHTCAEVVVPVKGSLTARITDANGTTDIHLSNPSEALYIPEMVWCEFMDFSEDCVCLCLASEAYEPKGYINSLEAYLKEVKP